MRIIILFSKNRNKRLTYKMENLVFRGYLAAFVRSARISAGLTQTEVAARANVTRRYIQSIENGKQEASISTLFSIASALNILPSSIIINLENAIQRGELPEHIRNTVPPQKIGRPPRH